MRAAVCRRRVSVCPKPVKDVSVCSSAVGKQTSLRVSHAKLTFARRHFACTPNEGAGDPYAVGGKIIDEHAVVGDVDNDGDDELIP